MMSVRKAVWCALAVALVVQLGCSNRPTRLQPPSIDAVAAGKQAIEMFDANKDGKISGEELDKCPGLKAAIARVDTTNSGAITAEQITARIRAWQDSKTGRTSLVCTIKRNGAPLADAEVKFLPEKFLGDAVKAGVGKTSGNGVASISIPDVTPPGVALGFYRVEITKGTEIPAKYNTETTLGQEVAHDMMLGSDSIDLKY